MLAIQFLDSRISQFSSDSTGTVPLPFPPAAPLLLGDIGLQVGAVIGTPNQADVRVELSGTIGVNGTAANLVTILVIREAISGFPQQIYTSTVSLYAGNNLLSFNATDFHPPVITSQIRYTMLAFDVGPGPSIIVTGPVSFSGVAQAGTS